MESDGDQGLDSGAHGAGRQGAQDDSDPSGKPTRQEPLDVFFQARKRRVLPSQKGGLTKGLVDLLNGLLSTAVYSPLVSFISALTSDMVVSSLQPHSKVEAWASFPGHLSKVLDHEVDVNTTVTTRSYALSAKLRPRSTSMLCIPSSRRSSAATSSKAPVTKPWAIWSCNTKAANSRSTATGSTDSTYEGCLETRYSQAARENKPRGEPEFVA